MIDRLVFVAMMFLYGILLGGTLCNLTCGPLLVLRLAGQGRGAKQGLLFATIFSAPRIVILTVLGVVVGYLGGEWGEVNEATIGVLLKPLLYLLISAIMTLSGIRFIMRSKRECVEKRGGLKSRITRAAFRIGPASGSSERFKLFGIGILVSLMCLSQGALASVAVSSALGISASDAGSGAFWGGVSMLFFSLGLSLPLIILGTGASWFGSKISDEDARKVGGLLLIAFGGFIALYQVVTILVEIF